jgi:hypothetical protein
MNRDSSVVRPVAQCLTWLELLATYKIRNPVKDWAFWNFSLFTAHTEMLVTRIFCIFLCFCKTISGWSLVIFGYAGHTQKNGWVSKVIKNVFLTLHRHNTHCQQLELSKFLVLSTIRVSCSLRGHETSFQDSVAAGEGFLCAPFWGIQICDYSAAWVSCTV